MAINICSSFLAKTTTKNESITEKPSMQDIVAKATKLEDIEAKAKKS